MSAANFDLLSVNFTKKGGGHWIFMSGEIANNSNKSYTSAVFRLSVFERSFLLWTGVIRVRNFRKRQTRPFDVLMEGLGREFMPRISRYEIFFESGY
jgi:hypothetical protein